MAFSTSHEEIRHLTRAWIFVSLAVAIALPGVAGGIIPSFLLAGITVGLGFLFHELGHKIVAQYYGLRAEFRADSQMLWVGLAISLLGVVVAAPGAVLISGRARLYQMGKIALAGPLANYIMAIFFFTFWQVSEGFVGLICQYGFLLNGWLGIFNMLPFWAFDGKKILAWNKWVYGTFVLVGIVIMQLNVIFS